MNILAIETSTDICSIALQANHLLFQHHESVPQQHGKVILSWIDDLIQTAKLSLNELTFIAFSCGPGSFTGLRIGASVVQSLAFTFNLPVVLVSSLCVLAQSSHSHLGAKKILIAQDARMNEVYFGLYQLNGDNIMEAVMADRLMLCDSITYTSEMKDVVATGNGFQIYPNLITQCHLDLDQVKKMDLHATDLLQIAHYYYLRGDYVNAEEAIPVYLRSQNRWKKMNPK